MSERKEPTASVVLQLKPGEELSRNQIRGIVHLVASSVPRLKDEDVSLVDTSGGVLYDRKDQENNPASMTDAQLAYQRKLDEDYRRKIQTMLDDVLGPNKTVVRVTADLDFDQVQTSEDRYDPDQTATRSEQKLVETDTSQEGVGGVPGVKGGLANKLQGNAVASQQTQQTPPAPPSITRQKTQDTTNYEITRVQKQVSASIGKLKRISVGVMVDGSYKPGSKGLVYAPRSPEEMASLENIVKAAIGFNSSRGDEVSIVNVPFKAEAPEKKAGFNFVALASRFARPFINLILALIFIFLVLRPILNRYVLHPEKAVVPALPGGGAMKGGSAAQLEDEGFEFPPPVIHPKPDVRERLKEMASAYPERAAALVKIWLREKERSGAKDGQPS